MVKIHEGKFHDTSVSRVSRFGFKLVYRVLALGRALGRALGVSSVCAQ